MHATTYSSLWAFPSSFQAPSITLWLRVSLHASSVLSAFKWSVWITAQRRISTEGHWTLLKFFLNTCPSTCSARNSSRHACRTCQSKNKLVMAVFPSLIRVRVMEWWPAMTVLGWSDSNHHRWITSCFSSLLYSHLALITVHIRWTLEDIVSWLLTGHFNCESLTHFFDSFLSFCLQFRYLQACARVSTSADSVHHTLQHGSHSSLYLCSLMLADYSTS